MAPERRRFISRDTVWLGGTHDGYPLSSFDEYLKIRPGGRASSLSGHEMAAQHQNHLTFGLLGTVMKTEIAESTLLRQNDRGETVMTDANLTRLLRHWRYRI